MFNRARSVQLKLKEAYVKLERINLLNESLQISNTIGSRYDEHSDETPYTSSQILEETEHDENSDQARDGGIPKSEPKEGEEMENDEIPVVRIPVSQLMGVYVNVRDIKLEKDTGSNEKNIGNPARSNLSNNQHEIEINMPVNVAGKVINRQMTLDKWISRKSSRNEQNRQFNERENDQTERNKTNIEKTAIISHRKIYEKSHKCKNCDKRFSFKSALERHIRTHSGEKPHQCDHCFKRFNDKTHLRRHMAIHTGEKPHQCDICIKRFGTKCELKRHTRTHKDDLFHCSGCFLGFSQIIDKEAHEKECIKRRYECYLCNRDENKKKKFVTNNKNAIEIHMRTHTGEKPHECKQCHKRFFNNSGLKYHIRIHTGEKPHQCDRCLRRFRLKSGLESHFLTHTGENAYQCDRCFKRFNVKAKLDRHMISHTGEKTFECNQCQKRFSHRDGLRVHLKIHTGEKSYQCRSCPKCYNAKNNLIRHMKTHTGGKPYECEYCTKRTYTKSDLQKHMNIHTGGKPYECEQCHSRFSTKTCLNRHISTHTGEKPYQCNHCLKRFRLKNYLNDHIRTHTGDKRYQCDLCEKRFIKKSKLDRHIRTHTGEKPQQCDHCIKRFSKKCELKRHMRTHEVDLFHCSGCYRGFSRITEKEAHERDCKTRRFECYICNRDGDKKKYVTTSKAAIVTHMRTHTGDKPHQCSQCQRRFNCLSNLLRHKKSHTGVKPHKCDHCHKRFADKKGLKRHVRTHQTNLFHCSGCFQGFSQNIEKEVHEKECKYRRYECYICNRDEKKEKYVTISKDNIIRHMKTHSKVKSYKCEYCTKRTYTKSDLKKHIRSHTGGKPHKCDHCQKRFTVKIGLKMHLRTHQTNLFHCSGCFQGFSQNIDKEVHEKECKYRRYECYICNRDEKKKKFVTISKGKIIGHLKRHSGDKPYQCDRCPKRYSEKRSLKWHREKSH